jgi:hypothetical protein
MTVSCANVSRRGSVGGRENRYYAGFVLICPAERMLECGQDGVRYHRGNIGEDRPAKFVEIGQISEEAIRREPACDDRLGLIAAIKIAEPPGKRAQHALRRFFDQNLIDSCERDVLQCKLRKVIGNGVWEHRAPWVWFPASPSPICGAFLDPEPPLPPGPNWPALSGCPRGCSDSTHSSMACRRRWERRWESRWTRSPRRCLGPGQVGTAK